MFEFYPYNYSSTEINNTILFKFLTYAPNLPVDVGFFPIETKNVKEAPYAVSGIDSSLMLLGRVTKQADKFEVEYRLKFRGIEDPISGKIYKIILMRRDGKDEKLSSTSGFITIIPGETYSKEINGQNYILTEVLIIL